MAENAARKIGIDALAASSPALAAPEDDGLALVARDGDFGDRYRIWKGRSGRRYLVTVMPLSEAMRVEHVVVLLVATAQDGARKIVWAGESGGGAPGLRVEPGVSLEAHVHLLAQDADRRARAIADLVDDAQGYSSVLTVSAAATAESEASTTPILSSSRAVFTT